MIQRISNKNDLAIKLCVDTNDMVYLKIQYYTDGAYIYEVESSLDGETYVYIPADELQKMKEGLLRSKVFFGYDSEHFDDASQDLVREYILNCWIYKEEIEEEEDSDTEKYFELKLQIAEQKQQIEELAEQIENNEKEIAHYEEHIELYKKQISDLEDLLSACGDMSEIESLTQQVSQLKLQIAELEKRPDPSVVEELNQQIAQLLEMLENCGDDEEAENLRNQVIELQNRISNLTTSNTLLTNEIAERNAEILELKEQMKDNEDEAENLRTRISELETEMEAATNRITELQESNSDLLEQIQLKVDIISSLNSDLETLNTQFQEVNLYLDDIKEALKDKGINVSNPEDYALAIADINSDGGELDFTKLNYEGTPSYMLEDYNKSVLAKEIIEADFNDTRISKYKDLLNKTPYIPSFPFTYFGVPKDLHIITTYHEDNLRSYFLNSDVVIADLSQWHIFNTEYPCTDCYYLFKNSPYLQKVVLPKDSLVKYFDSAFSYCNSLREVDFNGAYSDQPISCYQLFYECKALERVELPAIQISDCLYMFSECTNLLYLDTSKADFSSVSRANNFIYYCSKLVELGDLNMPLITSFLFPQAPFLKKVGRLNFGKVTNFKDWFVDCIELERVEYIDIHSATSFGITYTDSTKGTKIRYMELDGLGTPETSMFYKCRLYKYWGVNNEEHPDAKDSLIASLITNSFDRAAAGYNSDTIEISDDTLGVLSEEEIAQITAKGFTIA